MPLFSSHLLAGTLGLHPTETPHEPRRGRCVWREIRPLPSPLGTFRDVAIPSGHVRTPLPRPPRSVLTQLPGGRRQAPLSSAEPRNLPCWPKGQFYGSISAVFLLQSEVWFCDFRIWAGRLNKLSISEPRKESAERRQTAHEESLTIMGPNTHLDGRNKT